MSDFYDATTEHIAKLSGPWCASYSGGKDSTSVVTWIEYLRRSKQITVEQPRMVRSDTGVEEGNLVGVAEELTTVLEECDWECAVVQPLVNERLYCQILGRGLPPIHPGARRMRWCTRSTKIDPMNRWRDEIEGQLSITGLRLGESKMRDGKLLKSSCSAGGECGIPDPGEGRYSPILHWRTCEVIDWLNGAVDKSVRKLMPDVFNVTKKLVEIYGCKIGQPTLGFTEPEITAARYGCIGCPAIGAEAHAPATVIRRNGKHSPLNELYAVWHDARRPENRLVGYRKGKQIMGPIRMPARMVLFDRVMNIQRRAGVVLITPDDESFIRGCWKNGVYPRGWSSADEDVETTDRHPLFYNRSKVQ